LVSIYGSYTDGTTVNIFQLIQYFQIDLNLAKVGVEGSNPFARSNHLNGLVDRAFAAESGLTACDFTGVLIGTLARKWPKRAI
jgi:hypothetical protein